jgi:hypothetical protein
MEFFISLCLLFVALCILFSSVLVTYTLFRIFGIPMMELPHLLKNPKDTITPNDHFDPNATPLDQFVPAKGKPLKVNFKDNFDVE